MMPPYFQTPVWHGLRGLTVKEHVLLMHEGVRWWLAVGSGVATLAVLGAILGSCLRGVIDLATAKDLALTFLAPLVTLTVAVFGFYYGGND